MSTLAFEANPDYESPGDSGGNNVYEVTLVVTDSKGNSDEQDVTVKVTNVEEDGMIDLLDAAAARWLPGDGHTDRPGQRECLESVSWQWYRADISLTDTSFDISLYRRMRRRYSRPTVSIKDATSDTAYAGPVGDDWQDPDCGSHLH